MVAVPRPEASGTGATFESALSVRGNEGSEKLPIMIRLSRVRSRSRRDAHGLFPSLPAFASSPTDVLPLTPRAKMLMLCNRSSRSAHRQASWAARSTHRPAPRAEGPNKRGVCWRRAHRRKRERYAASLGASRGAAAYVIRCAQRAWQREDTFGQRTSPLSTHAVSIMRPAP